MLIPTPTPTPTLIARCAAMLIPAHMLGNVAVLKLPAIGGLVHVLTADAIMASFPPGVVNFVSGAGRKTMGPIMKTGLVECPQRNSDP